MHHCNLRAAESTQSPVGFDHDVLQRKPGFVGALLGKAELAGNSSHSTTILYALTTQFRVYTIFQLDHQRL